MELDKVIAENLKRLREQQNMSLGQLAEKAGLSKVMLGNLERGGSNPTINNIWKIANALGVPYTALLDSTGAGASVLRQNELTMQDSEDGHYRIYCYYGSSAERNFEWFLMELDAGSSYTSIGHKDRALEYVIVNQGELQIETQGQTYCLHAGDSISFQSSEMHHYRNEGEIAVSAYIINYYPR